MTPSGRIAPMDWMTAPETTAVIEALEGPGTPARFVGGCVRDAVLGFAAKDVDIATPLPPKEVVRRLEAASLRAIPTGIEHGTVTALSGGRHYEITTLRRDVETYGRRAAVAFTDDWVADAARRDFTVNAMFCDPDGTLYDPFDGRADLATGTIRFVGEAGQRIDEDALRLLRFFRFYARYGHPPPHPASLAACIAKAPSLAILSGERLREETLRLLVAARAAEVVTLMAECGVLAHYLPEAEPEARAGCAAMRRLIAIETERDGIDPLRRLAALLRGRGAENAEHVAERLRLSNREHERLVFMTAPPAAITAAMSEAEIHRAVYRFGNDRTVDLVLLAWADVVREEPDPRPWKRVVETAASWPAPKMPVKGSDVVARDIAPGPRVGGLIKGLEAWWMEEDFRPDRRQLLAKLDELIAGEAS